MRRAVVVGAGITGTLSALALLDDGWDVTLVEAREPGAGSSSRSAACIRQQFGVAATVRAMRYCVDWYGNFEERLGLERQAPVLVQNGYLFLHETQAQVDQARARIAVQQEAGLSEVELLEGDELARRHPYVAPMLGASFCPSDGFLRPDGIYLGAVAALRDRGAEVLLQATVTAAEPGSHGVAAVHTTRGVVAAELVVNATNAWASELSRLLGGVELPISAVKRYLYFLRRGGEQSAVDLAAQPMIIAPTRAYCRPENGEQLLLGWAHHAHHDEAFGHESQDCVEPAFHHAQGLDNYGVRLWMELARFLPQIADFRGLDATTAGYYASTPDHSPIIDVDPQVPNLIHAAGFSGHGAMMGPFSAQAVVARARFDGSDTLDLPTGPIPLAPFAFNRSFTSTEDMVI